MADRRHLATLDWLGYLTGNPRPALLLKVSYVYPRDTAKQWPPKGSVRPVQTEQQ